jgi:hypothetical protein
MAAHRMWPSACLHGVGTPQWPRLPRRRPWGPGGRHLGRRPRCVRMRAIRAAWSIGARNRIRPPHRAHARTSYQARLREALRRGPRDGRPQRVPARPFQACPITSRHDQPGMQIEARTVRVTWPAARQGRRRQLGRGAAPPFDVAQGGLSTSPKAAAPPSRAGRGRAVLHRRGCQPGQRVPAPRQASPSS